MKKILISAGLGLAACLSSFGQGYLVFADSGSTAVYDNFTTPGSPVKSAANVIVGLFWSTGSAPFAGFGSAASTTSTSPTWTGVTSDANYHMALSGGSPLTALTRTGLSLGTFNGGTVGIDGTSAGQTITLYVVAWKASDGANGWGTSSVLGWSNPITELLGSSASPGLTLAGGMNAPIYVNSVPEPATFALAGLGAAAMLVFRRRK